MVLNDVFSGGMGLQRHIIGEKDTPQSLSARYGVPYCAILRANRICSDAWMMPGREIVIPDKDFCEKDGFICPCIGVNILAEEARACVHVRVKEGDTAASLARKYRLPVRLICLASGCSDGKIPSGAEFIVQIPLQNEKIYAAAPMDSLCELAKKWGCSEEELRRENRLWGPLLPGMQILYSEREKYEISKETPGMVR